MIITGIGIDIEDISRFRKLVFDKNKGFFDKIFTSKEIKYCLSKKDPYPCFAARFCAKEAFIKAIDEKVVDYKLIEIGIDRVKPCIRWKDKTVFLSLSHEKDKAIAFVIMGDK